MAKLNNDLITAALQLQKYFKKHKDKFCIIGGIAVNAWGNPRTTQDIDISLCVELGNEERYIERFLQDFKSRITDDPRGFAEANRVLLLMNEDGIPIDVALSGLMIEEEMINRALPFNVGRGKSLLVAAPNDLIAMKVFANRDRDWVDIADLVVRLGDQVDWPHIERCVKQLCELAELSESLEKLRLFRSKLKRNK